MLVTDLILFTTLVLQCIAKCKLIMAKGNCKLCKAEFVGRQGKIFCSISCKSEYNHKLARVTNIATAKADAILHRNRSILLEILGKRKVYIKISRSILDRKKFNWHKITGYHINKAGKMVHYVYDFSWVVFSDDEVLIRRLNSIS